MNISVDQAIMQGIYDLLQTITVANGFNFDSGLNVAWGKITNTSDQIPCIFLLDGDSTNHDDTEVVLNLPGKIRSMEVQVRKRVQVEVHVPCDADMPNVAGHMALADLKAALFATDRLFGSASTRQTRWVSDTFGRREDGAKIMPVMLQFDITYTANQAAPKTT